MPDDFSPGEVVFIEHPDYPNGLRAVVVHRMDGACQECGADRYHCRLVPTGEDFGACVPWMRPPN
jgi:hypothetical protein